MAACASAALLAALREFWCFLRALGQNLLLGQTRPQLVAVFELSLDCACLRHINADATSSTTILTSMSQACPRFAPLRACSRRCLSRRRSTKDLCPAQKGWPACDPSSTSPTNASCSELRLVATFARLPDRSRACAAPAVCCCPVFARGPCPALTTRIVSFSFAKTCSQTMSALRASAKM